MFKKKKQPTAMEKAVAEMNGVFHTAFQPYVMPTNFEDLRAQYSHWIKKLNNEQLGQLFGRIVNNKTLALTINEFEPREQSVNDFLLNAILTVVNNYTTEEEKRIYGM